MAIFGQNWQFWEFLTYNFQTRLCIFLSFGMDVVLMVFFEKNHILHAWEIQRCSKFWPFKTKIWLFFAKIDSFESFWPITSKRRYESSKFLYGSCSYGVFWENHRVATVPQFPHCPTFWQNLKNVLLSSYLFDFFSILSHFVPLFVKNLMSEILKKVKI